MKELNVSTLEGFISCKRYIHCYDRHLAKESSISIQIGSVKKALVRSISKESIDEGLEEWNKFITLEYPLLPGIDRQSTLDMKQRDKISSLGTRFIIYAFNENWYVINSDIPYEYSLNEYKVHGKADLIVNTSAGLCAFSIKMSTNLSNRARSAKNMPTNNPRVISLSLGLSKQFMLDYVGVISLENSKDKADNLVENFADSQLIMAKPIDEAVALETLNDLLDSKSEPNCKTCYMAETCEEQIGTITNIVVPEDEKSSKGNLTASQDEVVNHTEGPMVVVAVPGAGKTHSLIERLKQMIQNGIEASQIVFVTFTRKAAGEIINRASSVLSNGSLPNVFTFHALGYQIISDHPELTNGKKKLATTVDVSALCFKAISSSAPIKGLSAAYLKTEMGIKKVLSFFDAIKETGIDAFSEKNPKIDKEDILAAFKAYETLFNEEGYFTYDEIVHIALDILKNNASILSEYQDKWKYFMADEYQDVSPEQAELLYLLGDKTKNIVVVGDDDQSIYGWRGGSSKFMLEFNKTFPNAKTIFMTDNFRTTKPILDLANKVINSNNNRFKKEILPTIENGEEPVVYWGISYAHLPLIIESLNAPLEDICILARKNAQLDGIYKTLCDFDIKARNPRSYLTEDTFFKYLVAILNIKEDSEDDLSFYKALVALGESIPDYSESFSEYIKKDMTLYEGSINIINTCLEILDKDIAMDKKVLDIAKAVSLKATHPVITSILQCIEESHIEDNKDFLIAADKMVTFNDDTCLEYPREKGIISLMTCHKAKGKEFPIVIIADAEEFQIKEDDRNLLYVAMTRAKRQLIMTVNDVSPKAVDTSLIAQLINDTEVTVYGNNNDIRQRTV